MLKENNQYSNMGDYVFNKAEPWTVVGRKKRILSNIEKEMEAMFPDKIAETPSPAIVEESPTFRENSEKISEPCWFFNNGGCKHKDGSEKTADECKYLHIYSENVKRPPHLSTKKPCDKYNLEGECNWGDNCKYSHRSLTTDEWARYYPQIPFSLKTNITLQKKVVETKVSDIEERIKVMEFKQDGMSKEIQYIMQGVQKCIRNLQLLMERK